MADGSDSIAPARIACKLCRRAAPLFGIVDFNKSCEDHRQRPFADAGVPIPYHRCGHCGFLFTSAFDHFTPVHFNTHIYNDQYILADPEYKDFRPRTVAGRIAQTFPNWRPLRILDYGCGAGLMAQCLREAGFEQIETYDPFVPEHARRPQGLFDLLISIEVVEHSADPAGTFRDMAGFLKNPGLVYFSTHLQPENIAQTGAAWWYVAPRNGHVSIHTKRSIEYAAGFAGCTIGSFDETTHGMFNTCPPWAKELLK